MNNQILPSTPSAKILSIVSTKGGVGKTTTAANRVFPKNGGTLKLF